MRSPYSTLALAALAAACQSPPAPEPPTVQAAANAKPATPTNADPKATPAAAAAPAAAVPGDASETRPLTVGAAVPDITLRGADGGEVKLRGRFADKPTVLIYYRGGWCPYCNTQLGALAAVEDKITAAGHQILAVSADKPAKLAESQQKHAMKYELLSDASMAGARALGIAFENTTLYVMKLRGFGMNIEEASGHDHHQLPVPSVFLIDTQGMVRFAHSDPNYKVRLDADALLAEVTKLAAAPGGNGASK